MKKNKKTDKPLIYGIYHKFTGLKSGHKVLLLLSFFALLLLIYGVWYFYHVLRPADLFTDPPGLPQNEEEKTPDDEVEWDVDQYFDKNIVNIALFGFDRDEERDQYFSVYRTDMIKVVSINFDENTVSLIDVPRDSYIRIADTPTLDKINHAYYYGYLYGGGGDQHQKGIEYALQSTSNLLGGVPFSYYVSLDMDAVVEMVDSIGGVRFDVPYDVIDKDGVLQLEKGEQVLYGEKYLHYLRNREVGGDLGRIQRQTELLLATLDHIRREGLVKNIPTLYNSYQELIDTNLTNQQMISLALYAARMDKQKIHSYTLTGTNQAKDGVAYYILSPDSVEEVMTAVFGIDYRPEQTRLTDTKPAAPASFSASAVDYQGKAAVRLAWEQGDKYNLKYNLYRSENGGEEVLLISGKEITYLDLDVREGTSYGYRLEAVNHRAVSDSRQTDVFVDGTRPNPDPPQDPGDVQDSGGHEDTEDPDDSDAEDPVVQIRRKTAEIIPLRHKAI